MATQTQAPEYDYINEDWFQRELPEFSAVSVQKIQESHDIDVLLIVATPVEREAAQKLLEPLPRNRKVSKVTAGEETYYVGRCGAFITALVMCEKGSGAPDSSQATATAAINLWNPSAVIMAGICFARDRKKQKPADVIVADKIIPYESQRVGKNKTVPRGPQPQVGRTLLNRFKNIDEWQFRRPDGEPVSVKTGPMLSGEKLVDDPKLKAELFRLHPDALAGEMEGTGIWAAAERGRIEWILVKAIVDWADGKKGKEYQPMAAAAACSLVHAVLSDPYALDGLAAPKSGAAAVSAETARKKAESQKLEDVRRLNDIVKEYDTRRAFYEMREDGDEVIGSVQDARQQVRQLSRGIWTGTDLERYSQDIQYYLGEFVTDAAGLNTFEAFMDRLLELRQAVWLIAAELNDRFPRYIRPRNMPQIAIDEYQEMKRQKKKRGAQ